MKIDEMEMNRSKSFKRPKLLHIAKETAIQYSEQSTVHGIYYIFERNESNFSHFLWILVTIGFAVLGFYWSYDAYWNWQENQVLTTVNTTGQPIQVQY